MTSTSTRGLVITIVPMGFLLGPLIQISICSSYMEYRKMYDLVSKSLVCIQLDVRLCRISTKCIM